MASHDRKSRNWREIFITPLIELVILLLALFSLYYLFREHKFTLAMGLFLFYGVQGLLSLVVLKIVRMVGSIHRGIYSYETNPWIFYAWRLHAFICSTNLSLLYINGLLPPLLRAFFYRLLGAHIGRGMVSLSGRILDPYLVRIGENCRIGDDVLLIPHSYSVGSSDLLVLENIEIKNGAVVGVRSTLMPGVVIGENSMVKAMSVVPMNTKIPANEIWGGVPAQKMADVDRPLADSF